MNEQYKPEGYSSVAPYLIVPNADQTIRFLTEVMGAVELRRINNDSGGIVHAEVRIDDSIIMLADAVPEWPPIGAHVYVYVSDVDTVYRRALDSGATSLQEPVQKDDDDKRGGVRDPGGTTWWIATRVG